MPVEYSSFTLDSYGTDPLKLTLDNQAAIDQAKLFADGTHPGLYVHGTVGTGKTLLLAATLNTIYRAGTACRFLRVTDMLAAIIADGDSLVKALIAVPVLGLDDVGSQKPTDWGRQTLVQVADGRIGAGTKTIWTSNLDLDELVAFLGDDKRLASRIMGSCKVVELDGPDYRMRKRIRKAG